MTTLTVSDRSPSDVKADALVARHRPERRGRGPGTGPRPAAARWPTSSTPSLADLERDRQASSEVHRRCRRAGRHRDARRARRRRRGAAGHAAPYAPEVLRRAAGAAVRAPDRQPRRSRSPCPARRPRPSPPSPRARCLGAYAVRTATAATPARSRRPGGRAARPARATAPSAQGRQARRGVLGRRRRLTRDLVNTAPEPALPADASPTRSTARAAKAARSRSRCYDEKALRPRRLRRHRRRRPGLGPTRRGS